MKLFDLHCDTIYECCETGKHLRENDLHINYAAAHRYQPYVQFFALFCGARQPYSPETRDCLLDTPADERFDRMLTTARREFAANADWLTFCRSAADIRAAVEAGKAAALLSIEGAELLPDRPDALDYVYDAGVRLITLTWNYRSRYGCSSAVDQNEGLTELGKQLVCDCGEKGILVDVSHLSDRGFWDVCEATDRPFVATHSDSRVLCRNSRNLTDEQFAEIANRRGLVGVNLYTPFLVRQSDSVIDDAIDHIERFIGILTEHFAGKFPTWLAPVQVKALPVSEKSRDYAHEVCAKLEEAGIRVVCDDRDEKIGYKIREARSIDRVPYMLILGEKEVEAGNISVRDRSNETVQMSVDEFVAKVLEEIKTRA